MVEASSLHSGSRSAYPPVAYAPTDRLPLGDNLGLFKQNIRV